MRDGFESAYAVWELLHAGDWACANGDDETLARVAADLARYLEGAQRDLALKVVHCALESLDEASLFWSRLTESLRADVVSPSA